MDVHSAPGNTLCYLILESRLSKAILQQVYETETNPEWEYLFAHTEWEPYLQESPIVLQAHRDSDLYRWAQQGLENNELSGLILDSTRELKAVADWARQRLSVQFESGRKGLLRFYDPLIWHRLAPAERSQEEVISSVTYWHGLPEDGRWLTSVNPEPVTMGSTPMLEAHQWQALNSADV